MSGMKNLANAMANDKGFKADGLLSSGEADDYVPQGMGSMKSVKKPKEKSYGGKAP